MQNKTQRITHTRRDALRNAAHLALAGGLMMLGGCASKPVVPPEPPKPPKPIRLLAVLPVLAPPVSETNTGFGATNVHVVTPVHTGPRGGVSASGAAAAVGVALIATAIIYGVREEKRKERVALDEALTHVNFDAVAHIQARLVSALERRDVRLVQIADPQLASDIRAGKFDGLPVGTDAILDVGVWDSGYVPSSRAGGYAPVLQLTATLRSVVPKAEDLDGFDYYADWRNGGSDRRWITTPKSMTFASIDKLKAESATARSGLEKLVEDMVAMMAQDIQRHAAGQLRVD
jgi:hypothetical protein